MSGTGVYRCCDERRRELIRAQTALNGIDYLEVTGETSLEVHFVNEALAPATITKENVVIDGGERIHVEVLDAYDTPMHVLKVGVKQAGDFSPYTLRLIEAGKPGVPLNGLDPQLASIDFRFHIDCDSDFDCQVVDACPPAVETPPRIDYLAKDYASFRQLMLDRLSLLLPGWQEGSAADLGVTLVELLAYVADRLSYQQDAIATEAYLGTARRRISVRRHARLVDYLMHDGANARVFVELQVSGTVTLNAGTPLFTRLDGLAPHIDPTDPSAVREALAKNPTVFETMQGITCLKEHNSMAFHAWGSKDCCLPAGATTATLAGAFPNLNAGDYLVFRELVDPDTGDAANANPARRHVVRLIDKKVGKDALLEADITDIVWHDDDALPFPLCISSTTDQRHGSVFLPQVSAAFGNVVLADHGMTLNEDLGTVPAATLFRAALDDETPCRRSEPAAIVPKFRPVLAHGPLTQHAPFDPLDRSTSATAQLRWSLADVLPDIDLDGLLHPPSDTWTVQRDLLESEPADKHFVAEVDDDGIATLRFGDDEYGERPVEGTHFIAHYRIGNGLTGNVGADAIAHVLTVDTGIDGVRNSLPARGGVAPETLEHARQSAPAAFRIQQRAVTEADYAKVTERRADVDRAAATFRWTGSWYTAFTTIDRHGGLDVDAAFRDEIIGYLDNFHVVGRDLEVDGPQFVSVELALTICVMRGFFRSDVEAALRKALAAFFAPDQFTFGQPVALSKIVAAAAAVDGVDGVTVDVLQRQGQPRTSGVASGLLPMSRLEIARLENSRNFPEHGTLTLVMRGGA